LIISGPNGSGKTTFAHEFLLSKRRGSIFINADLIAEGLSPLRPEMGIPKAMRLMGEPLNECMAARQVFAIVSTLAGLQLLRTSPGTPGRR